MAWKKYRLGELIDVKHGFAFKGEYFSDEPNENILLTPGNFQIGGGFKADKFKYYTGDVPEDYILNEGDIIVTMTDLSKQSDTLGYTAKVPKKNQRNYLHNQRLGLLKFKSSDVEKEFVYWIMRTAPYHSYIVGSATGSTVKHTSPSRITSYEFYAPEDKEDQVFLASVLTSLEDKIEINHQINHTVESIAQTLFKEWFVNLNFPGFNRELVNGLPKGWRIGKIGDVLELQYGKALKADTRIEGEFPVLGSSGIVDYHTTFIVVGPGIVIGRKGTIGEVIWVDENFFPIDTTFYVVDKIGTNGLYYHYFLLKQQDFKKIGSDSAVPGLNRNQAHENIIVIPEKSVVDDFNELVKPLFDRRFIVKNEIATLTRLRDSLLPKLMSGKIEIKA